MSFAIGIVPVCQIRKEASHRSELTSQLLFGETAEILETSGEHTRIRCSYDGYEGWCQTKQLQAVDLSFIDPHEKLLTAEWSNIISVDGYPMQLPYGVSLNFLQNGKAKIGRYSIVYGGKTWDITKALFSEEQIKQVSMQFLNTAYLWGGRTVYGIDCSGFVQQVYRFFGKKLLRDAYLQATEGELIGFLQEARCGDLAFFDNEEGRITHVGLLYNADTIIHSSGKVRIDKIDNMGIISSDTGERTHKLRIIKRYM